MSFPAKYPGVCAECGDRFPAGAQIKYTEDDELVHVDCDDAGVRPTVRGGPGDFDLSQPTARESLCGECFCHHVGECV